jgi:hypothetical protein
MAEFNANDPVFVKDLQDIRDLLKVGRRTKRAKYSMWWMPNPGKNTNKYC